MTPSQYSRSLNEACHHDDDPNRHHQIDHQCGPNPTVSRVGEIGLAKLPSHSTTANYRRGRRQGRMAGITTPRTIAMATAIVLINGDENRVHKYQHRSHISCSGSVQRGSYLGIRTMAKLPSRVAARVCRTVMVPVFIPGVTPPEPVRRPSSTWFWRGPRALAGQCRGPGPAGRLGDSGGLGSVSFANRAALNVIGAVGFDCPASYPCAGSCASVVACGVKISNVRSAWSGAT
jgi:hypothetical protein